MSLRHGLLGLLAEGPASGFDLARRFEELLGTVWPAQHPKIYEELRRLDRDGLIELESTGPRGRKSYRITDAGLDEIRRWLTDTEVDHTMRLQTLLRSLFFWLMSPEELRDHLTREATFYRETAEKYRAYAAAKDRGDYGTSPATQSMRVAIEAGIRLSGALADWAEWAQTVPPATPDGPA
ncbi:MAG: helix-turn-helix transcriptional regulator [Streptosporangiaceae bacterium]